MKKIIIGSGIEIKKVSASKNPTLDIYKEIPGEFPFAREVLTDNSRGKLWTIRRYSDSSKFYIVHLFKFQLQLQLQLEVFFTNPDNG